MLKLSNCYVSGIRLRYTNGKMYTMVDLMGVVEISQWLVVVNY